MTPSEYVQTNYKEIKEWLTNVTRNTSSHLLDDFVQEVMLIFLDHKDAQGIVDRDEAKYFIIRIALNQWRSSSSPFHRQIRSAPISIDDLPQEESQGEEYDISEDVLMDIVMRSLDDMYNDKETRYKSMIIILYHSLGNNYSEIQRRFDIPRTTVRLHYKSGLSVLKKLIKKNLKELNNGNFTLSEHLNQFLSDWCNNLGADEQQVVSMASLLFTTKYFSTT